jgi:quaternary ammonium compound-resistance protein SugE
MNTTAGWVMLIASGLVDVAWAVATKKADGFREPGWAALSLILMALFVGLLTKALQVLPVGTAYAVWTGIGAVGSVGAGRRQSSRQRQTSNIRFSNTRADIDVLLITVRTLPRA